MKKLLYLLVFVAVLGGVAAWLVLSSGTAFSEKSKFFVIEEGKTDKVAVTEMLEKKYIIKHGSVLSLFGSALGAWHKVKPGKYEVKHGESLLDIARMLKNGRQVQVKLVITKLRTKEDLAKLIGKNFDSDSSTVMSFLNSNDSLKRFNVDTSTVFTLLIPDTYNFYWNTSLGNIFQKLYEAKNSFWAKNNRKQRAESFGFSPEQAYILAPIVEEETNDAGDRAKIASVYMNRLGKNMPLQACPTIKYAMNNFTLTRIYEKYLFNPSPYNTYRNKGLPPGPICTPNPKCIDIVLDAPRTDYLFFVAKADMSGFHHFSSNFAEHDKYAKEYQKALDAYMARKKQNAEDKEQE